MGLLDNFPTTQHTALGEALARGDESSARRSVMERAYEPLLIYARQSSLRRIASAEDLVGGFFASRFDQGGDYLARWLASDPPIPLRRWLVNGLILYSRERIANEKRERTALNNAPVSCSTEPEPWRTLEQAWRDEILQCACARVAFWYAAAHGETSLHSVARDSALCTSDGCGRRGMRNR